MALLLNAQDLSKRFGAVPLFQRVSLNISEGDRLGLIGPNGSGKSTLLQILAGRMDPDDGQVAKRKDVRLTYVAQESAFGEDETIRVAIERAMKAARIPEGDREGVLGATLGRTGFTDFELHTNALSGGWRKRLAIAEALVTEPDLLLLDEPTNHLDLAGIMWLEALVKSASFATVIISHDRYFLENVATDVAELNRTYPDGIFRVRGNYSTFLERKEEFLTAQAKHHEALQNRVKTEIEWLRRGPKARTTKSKARIDKAHDLMGELKDLNARTRTSATDIDFSASDRKTKRLIEFKNVSYSFPGNPLFTNLSFTFTAGTRLGLVGPNGSGKTTILRLINGELAPDHGDIRQADNLRVVYFEQNRPLDPTLTLRRALAPDSDSVVYQDRTIHVASWASKFLFQNEQLNQPVSRLSGGERARVHIARLMLQPADVLLLDEPTNDLDIPTLEILEESLLEFKGALVLVTHDRFMLDRVSTLVLGLDGAGGVQGFADYSQWEAWRQEQAQPKSKGDRGGSAPAKVSVPKKKLSYNDNRDMETIEQRIADVEEILAEKRAQLEDPAVVSDAERLRTLYAEIEEAEVSVDTLYARWAELEAKMA